MAEPRPASTVVLIRCLSEKRYQIYMTKRPNHFPFLGGYYVFPGGRVDKLDAETVNSVQSVCLNKADHAVPASYWVAAVREVFEETGVLFARSKNGECNWGNDYASERKALLQNEITFQELLLKHSLTLDFCSMHYIGRRITPASSPIRFDTRFFLAFIPDGIDCSPNQEEIIAAEWLTPQTALEKWKKRDMMLVSPTIQVLKTLAKCNHVEDLKVVSIGESSF